MAKSKPKGNPAPVGGLQSYKFKLTGSQSLLMHNDNVVAADSLTAWRKAPENKRRSVAGDDRSPAWTWITYLYTDDDLVVIPAENLIAMLIKGGASFKTGRMGTLKSEAAASVFFDQSYPLLVGPACKPVDIDGLDGLEQDAVAFSEHAERARKLGFTLDVRRASVGTSKHVRVRPCFHQWSIAGEFKAYDDGALGIDTLQQLFALCGRRVGLGDWRPSAPKKPGPHGTFTANVDFA